MLHPPIPSDTHQLLQVGAGATRPYLQQHNPYKLLFLRLTSSPINLSTYKPITSITLITFISCPLASLAPYTIFPSSFLPFFLSALAPSTPLCFDLPFSSMCDSPASMGVNLLSYLFPSALLPFSLPPFRLLFELTFS